VVAIELLTAARGLDLRTAELSVEAAPATAAAVRVLREQGVGGPGPDRYLSPEIEAAVALVASGAVLSAVEEVIGELA
jgi:histidine ammonia-lyase